MLLNAAPAAQDESVAVAVTAYNHARFLPESIASVLAQTVRPAEIVVVDDGSTDRPEDAVATFPGVRLVRRSNGGVAAARNTGLQATNAPFVVFLDADDRLLPGALAAGLAAHRASPGCGFVYGGFRRVDAVWRPISRDSFTAPGDNPFRAFLGGDIVRMPGTVMYSRAVLEAAGGFDETLSPCDDYEIYLRLSRLAPVAAYDQVVAEYRWHGGNISGSPLRMLPMSLVVHRRYRPDAASPDAPAWAAGRRDITRYYVGEAMAAGRRALQAGRFGEGLRLVGWSFRTAPADALRSISRAVDRRLRPGRRPAARSQGTGSNAGHD